MSALLVLLQTFLPLQACTIPSLTPTKPMDRLFVFFAPRMTFFSGAAAFLGGILNRALAGADVLSVRRKKQPAVVFEVRWTSSSIGGREGEGRRDDGGHRVWKRVARTRCTSLSDTLCLLQCAVRCVVLETCTSVVFPCNAPSPLQQCIHTTP